MAPARPACYAGAVSGDPVIVEPGHHVAGEYAFTPDLLTLSIYRGPPLVLEQAATVAIAGTARSSAATSR